MTTQRETRWQIVLNRGNGAEHACWIKGSEKDAKEHCRIVNANGIGGHFSVGKSELVYTRTEKLLLRVGNDLWVGPPLGNDEKLLGVFDEIIGDKCPPGLRNIYIRELFQTLDKYTKTVMASNRLTYFRLTPEGEDLFLSMRPEIDAQTFKDQCADLLPITKEDVETGRRVLAKTHEWVKQHHRRAS